LIHPTAIIDSRAELAPDVRVGAFSIIGAGVKIDEGCEIAPHVMIEGPTQLGKRNKVFQFASVGAAPQDKKYRNEPTRLVIGDDNTIRENATLNRGTIQDRGETTIGNRNWIMAGVHIAHDCIIGNDTIFANAVALAGHVSVEDHAILGGYTLVHQFCRIGAHSFCGMGSVFKLLFRKEYTFLYNISLLLYHFQSMNHKIHQALFLLIYNNVLLLLEEFLFVR
jgi:UDP-N-acetylglucosamine acyltransferase